MIVSTDATSEHRIQPFDLQRQEALERGRLRKLGPVLEVMAHRIAGSLTSTLRLSVRVEVGDLEQKTWEEYSNSLPDPTFLTSVTVIPFGGRVVLHLPPDLSMTIVELRLGGDGRGPHPARILTEIEQRLVGEVATQAIEEMPSAFAPVIAIGLGQISSVTSSTFLQALKPTEMCLLVKLSIEIGEIPAYDFSVCLPLIVLLPILDSLERLETQIAEGDEASSQADLADRIVSVPVDATVCFPEIQLSPGELLSLAPDDIVRLHVHQGVPLVLRVGGVPYCQVVATSRGKRLAAMVTEIDKEKR